MSHGRAVQRVLIADSDPVVAADLEARLTALGYRVAGVAASARELIALAEQVEPQVVLIDAALGDGTEGIAAAAQIRGRRRIPILFTVADSDEASLRRIRGSGPHGYLLKPFADRELRVALTLALDQVDTAGTAEDLEERFFDLSIDMLCHLGFDGRFARLNPAWERTLGFTREELMSRPFIDFVHPDDRERTLKQNREVRNGGQAHSFENRYLCKDGSYRWLRWNAAPDTRRHTIYSVARDVTQRKRSEAALERLSTTDELTGLWNRRGFAALATQELKRVERSPEPVLMFYVDLDDFKVINDSYGHAEGDRVLVEVARLLQDSCRGGDIVARQGGDEFAILALDGTGDVQRLIPERISLALQRLNALHDRPYRIELTIGAACHLPGEEADFHDLLARADQQMYWEKRQRSARS